MYSIYKNNQYNMNNRLFWCIILIVCTFTVIKAQTPVGLDTITWPATGGEFLFPVESKSTKDWKVEVKDSPEWMTVDKKGETGFMITMQPNESGIDRKATVRLFSDEKELLIPFLQFGSKEISKIGIFDFHEQYQWMGAASEWGNKWTASVNHEANDWAYAARHGDDMIMVYLRENTDREKRTLQLTIQDEDKELAVFQINQLPDALPLSAQNFSVSSETSTITLDAGVTDSLVFRLPEWISLHSQQKIDKGIRYELAIKANLTDIVRYDSIHIQTESGSGSKDIAIAQYGHSPYTPLGTETLCDIPVKVISGEASSFQPGESIEQSFDGIPTTIYHSAWDNSAPNYFPITLTYKFQKPEALDYVEYYPRVDGGINGIFRSADILIQTTGDDKFRLIKNVDFEESATMKRIDFPETLQQVIAVQFIVKSGVGPGNGLASCAEMKFYHKANISFRYTDLFKDSTCSALKPGITKRKIERCRQPFFRNLALHMLQGKYPTEFRIQNYKAWMIPDVQARENGVMSFSLLDNPTGIAAIANEPLVLFVDREVTDGLALIIQNLNAKPGNDGFGGSTYPLHKGLNVIHPTTSGLIYILYQSKTPEAMPLATIHFATGRVNGYFDANKHMNSDGTSRWDELLARAGDQFFDVLSNHVHFTFRAEDFRRYVPNVNKLLAAYDTLVCHEQEFEGLKKYNRWMKNRLYIHTTYREMLYASPYHIGFQEAQLKDLLNPDSLKGAYCWGPAHELGHVLQIVPSMTWTAMTEVTNNIQSMEIQRLWGNPSRLHTESRSANGFEDIYEQAMNVAFVQKRPFTYLSDWFDQLVPFWQLRLYMMDVCGKTDFYKDVYEASRQLNTLNPRPTSGQLQLEFVYNSCVAAGMDLRPFFEKWGWLQPTERLYDDYYGKDTIIVNAVDVENLKLRIDSLHLPKLNHAAEYITDNTLKLYTHPQSFLAGTVQVNTETGDVKVQENSGVVAFEVFSGSKLIGVSYRSTFKITALNSIERSKIRVQAVAPDGKRADCTIRQHEN